MVVNGNTSNSLLVDSLIFLLPIMWNSIILLSCKKVISQWNGHIIIILFTHGQWSCSEEKGQYLVYHLNSCKSTIELPSHRSLYHKKEITGPSFYQSISYHWGIDNLISYQVFVKLWSCYGCRNTSPSLRVA